MKINPPLEEKNFSVMVTLTPRGGKKIKAFYVKLHPSSSLSRLTHFKPHHQQFRPSNSPLQLPHYRPFSHDCHHYTNDAAPEGEKKTRCESDDTHIYACSRRELLVQQVITAEREKELGEWFSSPSFF